MLTSQPPEREPNDHPKARVAKRDLLKQFAQNIFEGKQLSPEPHKTNASDQALEELFYAKSVLLCLLELN